MKRIPSKIPVWLLLLDVQKVTYVGVVQYICKHLELILPPPPYCKYLRLIKAFLDEGRLLIGMDKVSRP
jgi:hypothetical protein